MACYYFKYIPLTGSALYLDDEPIGWDKVVIRLKRDRDWHGMNYEYTDEDIGLEFDCLSGSAFIEEIYQAQGGDGYIGFEFGYYDGVTEIPEYEGKINLATRKLLSTYRIGATLERDGLHDLVKARWATKADLFSSKSIDGDTISAPTPLELELHSKVLVNNFTLNTTVEGDTTFQPFLENELHDIWFVFNTQADSGTLSNIDATAGSNLGPTGSDPVANDLALLFDLNSSGTFVFNLYFSYAFNIKMMRKTVTLAKPKIGAWYLDHWIEIRDINGTLKSQQRIGTQLSGTRDGQFLNDAGVVNTTVSISNYTVDCVFGDKIYVYSHFNLNGYNAGWKGLEAYITTYQMDWDIEAETTTEVSSTKMTMVHETLNQTFAYITGQSDAIYSDFFGREDLGYALDGCGSKKAIASGFQVRKFNAALNPPKLSAQEIMTSLNGIFCIGMGYEEISGQNKLRIEDRGYFYQDVEIMEVLNVGKYTEEVATEKIHNNVLIGYSKYLDEGLNLLDEYNTEHQYVTPIKNSDNPLDLRSSLIGSGYALEITRRAQFSDQPKDSTKYDDDCFFIAVIDQPTTAISGTFSNDTGAHILYTGTLPYTLKSGDRITISGTVSNNGTYDVMSDPADNKIFLGIYAVVVETAAAIVITNLTRPYATEKNAAFDTVTGVISPATSYNLRHTPKRNLMNHAKWLNGGMYFKYAGDLVRNTFVKQNGELTTQFSSGETCQLGDINLDSLQEKADVFLAQFQEKDYYFIPEWVTFQARVPIADIRFIKDCMTGKDLYGRNYGYITVVNQDGNYVQCWIYDLAYNPNTENCDFVCLKKEVILLNPPSALVCADYSDYTFAMFEALPDLSIDIEQCRFVNFN